MNRRRLLSLSACASASAALRLSRSALAQAEAKPEAAALVIPKTKVARVPIDFTGLSYEMPQLYNPDYFSAANTGLVKAFRDLSPNGILRMGGNLSDVARWNGPNGDFATAKQTAGVEHGKSYWEWKLTDSSVRVNKDGAITPASIRRLREFLDATNWRLIYGFNFGCGSLERAADEGAFVAQTMGDRLLSFQVGNEADFFVGNPWFRTRSYNYNEYLSGYKAFVKAVRARVPAAPFSGPDTATNMSWVERFAASEGTDVKLVTSHFYAMGPAKDPAKNAALLLSRNPALDTQIAQAKHAIAANHGPGFRMTEGNSCFGGGKPGVSDAFASSLWGADYMLTCAQAGYLGVNLHGGGDGFYTPIAVGDGLATELRPLYFGMQFAQQFAGFDMFECEVRTTANLTAYAGSNGSDVRQIALINKGDAPVRVSGAKGFVEKGSGRKMVLSGPSIEAKNGVTFREEGKPGSDGIEFVPAYSATLLRWD